MSIRVRAKDRPAIGRIAENGRYRTPLCRPEGWRPHLKVQDQTAHELRPAGLLGQDAETCISPHW
eukprot:3431738-Rhodomonas_salina.1